MFDVRSCDRDDRVEAWRSTHTLAGFERTFAQIGAVRGAVIHNAKEARNGWKCTPRSLDVCKIIAASSSSECCSGIEECCLVRLLQLPRGSEDGRIRVVPAFPGDKCVDPGAIIVWRLRALGLTSEPIDPLLNQDRFALHGGHVEIPCAIPGRRSVQRRDP